MKHEKNMELQGWPFGEWQKHQVKMWKARFHKSEPKVSELFGYK